MTLDPDLSFRLANGAAALAWLALIASPASASWSRRVWWLAGRVLPLSFSVLYLLLLATHWRGQGGFGSIAEVQALFAVPGALAAGWVHYLAFDLFVGAWIAQRSAQLGLSHAWVVPLLLLTFLFGPLGLLAFVLLRAALRPASLSLQPVEGAS
jgi:Domain of unknown function (DUF4281)